MEYTAASYEDYRKASRYAKLRYRFGVYIQFIALALLLFLLYYTVTNIEEMKANPADYAEEKLGVMCFYPMQDSAPIINGNYRSDKNITIG